jgi:C-terminal processing protease CtpA/Prc
MTTRRRLILFFGTLGMVALACQTVTGVTNTPTSAPLPKPTSSPTPAQTPTALPPAPVTPGESNPDEPVFISGEIPYTSRFFVSSLSEPFVLLEDEAGFVHRNRDFQFSLNEQVLGPVEIHNDQTLTYSLSLPAVPQGTQVDVDNNGKTNIGVQVFAVAYWSNTWGGPFLEQRDGGGWSTAYASTITDPENDDEVKGGILVIWSPDDEQAFPTGFGEDGKLFTEDDPTAPVPAGYSLVDLNQEPFRVYKEAHPEITLNEGGAAVNDYSKMSYSDAFEALFDKASREYPFTTEKNIDWQALHDKFAPVVSNARNDQDFYRAIRDFLISIPDGHVGVSFDPQVVFEDYGGGFGLVISQLSDQRVIVTNVLTDTPAAQAGIQVGAEIITWDGKPVSEAIDAVTPLFGPYSTESARHLGQVVFLTHVPPQTRVQVSFQNPGAAQPEDVTMQAVNEYDSLFAALNTSSSDELALPVEAKVLDDSGFAYIRVSTFLEDDNLEAHLWDTYIKKLVDNKTPGLIIDIRSNGGGNGLLATDFAGYFFSKEIPLSRSAYYNDKTGKFEFTDSTDRILPGTVMYDGPIAVLVSPDCVSACELFAYALKTNDRSTVVGNYPTAGAFGEVGRGQYNLPGGLSVQFPTGKFETIDGKLLLEGVGVVPDITVPVTEEGVLGKSDTVLDAAVKALQDEIK